jgi:hypothetical protein
MSNNTFTVKNLRVTFTLTNSNAVFPGSGATQANQLQIQGLRMSAVIKGAGLPAYPEASLRIYGLAQQDMNALAVVQVLVGKPQYTRNTVQIEADSGNGFVAVFTGQIIQAGPDYSSLPDVCLYVQAVSLGLDQLAPAAPIAYPGTANVADIVSGIASAMGCAFENDGVTGTLSHAYYSGTLADQLRTVCQDAGIYYAIEPGTPNIVIISPAGIPRQNLTAFTLTPTSGLVGYPEVLGNGYINVRSVFNPTYRMNGPLTISGSDVVRDTTVPTALNTKADGSWIIGPLTHTLECQKPGGAWFTDMRLGPPNAPSVANL